MHAARIGDFRQNCASVHERCVGSVRYRETSEINVYEAAELHRIVRQRGGRLADIAAVDEHRVPTIRPDFEFEDQGCLLGYAPDRGEFAQWMASDVQRRLGATKPGEVPFHQTSKWERIVSQTTAKGLGLSIPPDLLTRTDEVIGMKRRFFLCQLAGALVAGAVPAAAQTSGRTYRLGHLGNSKQSENGTRAHTLPELAKAGFVEGRNLVFDGRVGNPDAMPDLMRELLALRPDAIVAIGQAAIRAAGAATRTVPIVTFGADLIDLGLAQGYARPGGNVTGVVILGGELEVKRLSILHEAAPDRRRVAILLPSTGAVFSDAAMGATAARLGIELLTFDVSSPADYPAAFAAMRAKDAAALVIGATPEFYRDAMLLAELAIDARLPTVCEWADMAHSGCLIGYGPNRTALRKRLADQIAQIFRGTAPGEIAIERPTEFEFAINQKVAKSLDLSIPLAVLARADEVIE